MPILLSLVLAFSSTALTACGNSDSSSNVLKDQLLNKAEELNEQYSKTSDAFTRFDSITVPANSTIQFNYTLLSVSSDMITPDIIAMWSADAYSDLPDSINASEDVKFFSDRYVKIVYYYGTNDGAEFTTLTFTRNGYNSYAASSQESYVPPSASNPPSDEDVGKLVSFIAAVENAGCPMDLDNNHRIDSVIAPTSKTLQYNYTLTDIYASPKSILQSQILYDIKADRSAKWVTMKNCGVTFAYSYSDGNGQPLFTLTFTPDDYR